MRLICSSEEKREILKCTVSQTENNTEKTQINQLALTIQPQGQQQLLSQVFRKLQGKKNSGLSHWAAIGNLKSIEIKDRGAVIISEETLLSASSKTVDTRSLCQRHLQTHLLLFRLVLMMKALSKVIHVQMVLKHQGHTSGSQLHVL